MKTNILLLLMSLSIFMAADASCYGGSCYYAKFFSGANFMQTAKKISANKPTYQTGYNISASLGYCWQYGLRLEGEYAYRKNTIREIDFFGEGFSKHGQVKVSSYMANVLWDLPLSLWGCPFLNIKPFVGAGCGYDYRQMHSSNSRIRFTEKWHHFSWALMAGLAYPVIFNTEVTLEYKFHQAGCRFNDHTLGAGLLYKF